MIFRAEVVVRLALVWQGVFLVEDLLPSSTAISFTVALSLAVLGLVRG